ncbi:MAG TPA: choice-of-anchor tandem repeat GloVer-containing protein [Candidatus Sulfotelmatobacter sp.]
MSWTRFQEVTALPAPSAHISFRRRTGSLRPPLMLLLLVGATAAPSSAQTFKTLYNFCRITNTAGYCLDGRLPSTTLVQGTNGNLYGTTTQGEPNDYGTVFAVTTAGKLTTIYSFCSQASCTDGNYPEGGLLLATNGSFCWQALELVMPSGLHGFEPSV